MSNHTVVMVVMFIDVVSSSVMTTEMLKALKHLQGIIRRCVADHKGVVVKSIGDGYFTVFDDSVKAVQSATVIQRTLAQQPTDTPISSLQVRIGLHTGELQVREGGLFGPDYIGVAVEKAARIEELAQSGEVLVSKEVINAVKHHRKFKFQPKEPTLLKGIGEETIWRVVWSRAMSSQPKLKAR